MGNVLYQTYKMIYIKLNALISRAGTKWMC